MSRYRTPAIAGVMMLAAFASHATTGYRVEAGIAESDNIRREPTGKDSGAIASAGLELEWREQRERLNGHVSADIDYVSYLDNTYDDEAVGNFLGSARWDFVPRRLGWTVSDHFGQTRVNPLLAVTPDNRENINFFSTGPDFNLPVGATNLMTLSGRYSSVIYETSPLDSRRYSVALGLKHNLSEGSHVSVNARGERVEFEDSTAGPDYDRNEAYLSYEAEGSRTRLALDLGYSRLKLDDDATGEPVARLELSRRLSRSSILAASFGREYSDAGNTFVLQQTLGGAGLETQPVVQSATPISYTYGTLAWNFERRRSGLGLSIGHFEEAYQGSDDSLDRTRWAAAAQLRRELTHTVGVTVTGTYARENFKNVVGDARDRSAAASLNWSPGRRWSFTLQAERLRRTSEIAGSEYTENRAWLRVGFGRRAEVPEGPIVPPLPSDAGL